MKSAFLKALITVPVIGCLLVLPGSAMAGGSSVTCVSGECQFMPATLVTEGVVVETSNGHGTSSKTVSINKIRRLKRKQEKRHNVRYVVYEKENGSPSTSCVDPLKMNWGFHAGDVFLNHRESGLFKDHWIKGWHICDFHFVTKGKHKWAVGEKENCGNSPIWIPVHFKLRKRHVKKTIEFKSWSSLYEHLISKKTIKSESTSESERVVTKQHYTCPAGWELSGSTCKNCPPPTCEEHPCGCHEPPPPPPPHECPYGSVWNGTECVKNGYTTPPPPVEAPGENPPPSGGEGDPGSNMCYDEVTGEPVAPREGLCPPGSYGSY